MSLQTNALQTTLSVTQLNTYVKSLLESDFNLKRVYLTAEISNFTNHYRSGHMYMTLKDEKSSVRAVMFAGNASHLQFLPENGMKVLIRGRVSLYERDGQFQVYMDSIQPDGLGALHVAFEQLKEKLSKEGLFSEEHKKKIPKYPSKIGVITSPTGAAVQDIQQILSRRFPSIEILLFPVKVQGDGAAQQIASAIDYFNENKLVDTIIVGRGGGSIEDLWAFNEEVVARAIFASSTPIISAVGHETDYTIADFVSDLRASTPSAAAELAVPVRTECAIHLNALQNRMSLALNARIDSEKNYIETLQKTHLQRIVESLFADRQQQLDMITLHAKQGIDKKLLHLGHSFSMLASKADSLSPLKTLARGFAIVQKDGKSIVEADSLSKGDVINIKFLKGVADCNVLETRDI